MSSPRPTPLRLFSRGPASAVLAGGALIASALAGARVAAHEGPAARALENSTRVLDDDATAIAAVRILEARCVECHGPQRSDGGLRLDTRAGLLAGGDSGAALELGDAEASELVYRVTSELGFERMPYEQTPLASDDVAVLRDWIDAGAPWPESTDAAAHHWAFAPLASDVPPHAADARPIDAFVDAHLAEVGVEPSPAAEPHTLVRRLHIDLLGLPPEPEVVDAFVADPSDDAYARLVDDLLASPHFAERWARHWMDRARYADSDGYEKDEARPFAWLYREWLIDSIHRDVPWDRFTIEQLAGDLVPNADWRTRLGTAFHRQTLTNKEGGADREEFRVAAVLDRTNTVATTWLGLTAGCAQCHDHKYEQMSQREYYQLYAFFDNADERSLELPLRAASYRTWRDGDHEWEQQRDQLRRAIDTARANTPDDLAQWVQAERRRVRALVDAVEVEPLTPLRVESSAGDVAGPPFGRPVELPRPIDDRTTVQIEVAGPLPLAHGFALRFPPDASHHADGDLLLSTVLVGIAGRVDGTLPLAVDHARSEPPVVARSTRHLFRLTSPTNWIAPGGAVRELRVYTTEAFEVRAGESLEVRIISSDDQRRAPRAVSLGLLRERDPVDAADAAYRALMAPPGVKIGPRLGRELRTHRVERHPPVVAARAALAQHEHSRPDVPRLEAPVLAERTDEQRRTTHLFERGDFLSPAEPVEPGVLAILPPLVPRDPESGADRLDLARWITAPTNGLARRVAVNQIWQRLFGVGLVRTPDDFGVRGTPPTHPELLDWLARRFGELGLSRKALVREIVLSKTYRRSSIHRDDLVDIDPSNRLLARQNRFRVEAEIVRDLSLATAGLLETKLGGPSVFPPMDASVAAHAFADSFRWETSAGANRYRRGLYTFVKRTALHPNLAAFDCPTANVSAAARARSNTPIQALATLNNEVFVEAAVAFAARLLRAGDATDTATSDDLRLTRAFELTVARPPSAHELEALHDLLASARQRYAAAPDAVDALLSAGPDGLADEPLAATAAQRAELAALAVTCRVLLNLDEFLTRE